MWSTISSAPAALTLSLLLGLAVAMTYAPARLASCTAYPPTGPPAPLISNRWPDFSSPASKSACEAVSPTDGNPAASVNGMRVGAFTSTFAGATTYCAAEPSAFMGMSPTTFSPTVRLSTPSPSASIVPETSYPGTCGGVIGIGRKPPRMPPSAGLYADPATWMRTSPAPGTGWSTSS